MRESSKQSTKSVKSRLGKFTFGKARKRVRTKKSIKTIRWQRAIEAIGTLLILVLAEIIKRLLKL